MNKITDIFKKHFERFIAFFIDWFIILLPNVLVSILLSVSFEQEDFNDFFEIRLGLTYFIYYTFSTTKFGQTIGKKLIHLKVVAILGANEVNLRTSIYRHLPLSLLFIFSFFIPLTIDQESQNVIFSILGSVPNIWLISEIVFYLIRNNGQMLHDYLAGTIVVKQNKVSYATL